jgi:uncharacterized protein YfaP (DUF2135 family)
VILSAAGLALLVACSKSPSSPSTQGTPDSPSASALSVTATWDTGADVDLHVLEPSGAEIYWANPGPTTFTGVLDGDANQECKASSVGNKEVVHWTTAPNGTYTVRLDYYNSCNASVTNYTVAITDGKTTLPPVTGQFNGIGDVGNSAATVRIFTRSGSSLARLTPRRVLQSAPVLALLVARG